MDELGDWVQALKLEVSKEKYLLGDFRSQIDQFCDKISSLNLASVTLKENDTIKALDLLMKT